MKLPTDNYRLGDDLGSIKRALLQVLPMVAKQVNATSEGRIGGAYNALESPPTNGLWSQGDFVRNATPVVKGTAGSRYIVLGWSCVESGEPGTWVECRTGTGT
jgi:hypothetical protein